MTALAGLLGNHPDALLADFYRYYGDAPRSLHGRGVPLTHIAAMAANLPPDSAVARAIRPPEPDDVWTLDAQLTATAVDLLGGILAIQRARFEGKRRVSFPDPIQRPGVGSKEGTDNLGGDTFDSAEAWDEWYASQAGGRRTAVQ